SRWGGATSCGCDSTERPPRARPWPKAIAARPVAALGAAVRRVLQDRPDVRLRQPGDGLQPRDRPAGVPAHGGLEVVARRLGGHVEDAIEERLDLAELTGGVLLPGLELEEHAGAPLLREGGEGAAVIRVGHRRGRNGARPQAVRLLLVAIHRQA